MIWILNKDQIRVVDENESALAISTSINSNDIELPPPTLSKTPVNEMTHKVVAFRLVMVTRP